MINMTPYELVVLLAAGFFYILSAGAYAFTYTYGRMRSMNRVKLFSLLFVALMLYCAYLMISSPVFTSFWKTLLTVATFTYLIVPRAMWWVVVRIHNAEREKAVNRTYR